MLGMALDGGAMRLSYFTGFLHGLQEHDVQAEQMVGISIGALMSMGYLAGVPMKETFDELIPWAVKRRFTYDIYGQFLDFNMERYIRPEHLERFNGRLKIVATRVSLLGLETRVFDSYSDMQDLRRKLQASGSLPYLNEFPVRINDDWYVDGYATCWNPAVHLDTPRKLTVVGIPEWTNISHARELGDVVVMDDSRGHGLVSTFLLDEQVARDWFEVGHAKALEYLKAQT